MLLEFEKKVADFIEANGLFGPGGKILLAVSGGADSTALLYALCSIKAENIFSGDVLCAHLNHQLRSSESDGDEAFVIAQAEELKLAVVTKRLDVRGFASKNKLSIETAARKLRIENLLDIAKNNNCIWITTAHQKDDNAETIIQRLIRGTGFRGLGGIWPVRNFADGISFVRPLLCVGRDEILEYLKKRNLKWREDRTNVDCAYRRNFIRHRLLPAIQQQCSSSIVEQLWKLSRSAQRFYSLAYNEAEKVWPDMAEVGSEKITLNLKSFSAQPSAVKIEIVRRSLLHLGSGERDLTQQHYERVLQSAQQNTSNRKIELPDGFVVRREYGGLIFARCQESYTETHVDETVELQIPGRTQFSNFLIEATTLESDRKGFEKFKQGKTDFIEWFDLDKVNLPVTVRFRRAGDKFRPLGLAGEKRVGKFLTAIKTPQEIRKKAIIVTDAERIIWVWPVRTGERAKVTDETRKILQLHIVNTKMAY